APPRARPTGNREDVGVQAEGLGLGTVGAAEEELRLSAVPGRGVEDGLAVRAEPRVPGGAPAEGELVERRRLRRRLACAEPVARRHGENNPENRGERGDRAAAT